MGLRCINKEREFVDVCAETVEKSSRPAKSGPLLRRAKAYMALQKDQADSAKAVKEARDEIVKMAGKIESKTTDDKGNVFVNLKDGEDTLVVKLESRSSFVLDNDLAVAFAARKGISKLCTHVETIADQASFEALVLEGKISSKEYKKLIKESNSTALKVYFNSEA